MNFPFPIARDVFVRPKNRRSRRNWIQCAALGGFLACVVAPTPLLAQANSWTNPAGGNWQDSSWSLGVLPGPGQDIFITNAGWKAVSISDTTAVGFPQTLTVNSITLSSPVGTSNTLLLNYAGVNNPLNANSLTVGSNSAVTVDSSALLIATNITVAGTLTEDFSSLVTNWSLDIENGGPGGYILNSGLLTSGAGEDIGFTVPATFTQNGGTNFSTGIRIYTNSVYRLNGGFLNGIIIVRPNGTFQQQGGLVDNSTNIGDFASFDGTFLQSGGTFLGPTNDAMYFPAYVFLHQGTASGTGLQTGGTNVEGNLMVGLQLASENQDSGSIPSYGGTYTLSNGVLNTAGTIVGGNGTMEQAGGTHTINGTLSLQGALYYLNNIVNRYNSAAYTLDGGSLSSTGISLGVAATFLQHGGTNQVLGDVSLTRSTSPVGYSFHGRYNLSNGQLTASNIYVLGGELSQSGGQIYVSNNLQVTDGAFEQYVGQIRQSGLFTLADASWIAALGNESMGPLLLGVSDATSSYLTMHPGAGVLTLGDSSGITWSNAATLSIANWAGSIYGGGNQRIIFGNSSSALTGQQLSQISFANPAGLAAGNYPARILATGEIVPGTGSNLPPSLSVVRSNSAIQISLGGQIGTSYAIQTSTDLVHWASWTTQTDTTGTISITDSTTTAPLRFYRAVALP